MRWLTFALLGIIAICIQTTAASVLALGHVRPDFVFILLVHYALHARGSDGPIAAWVLGLMMELTSAEPLGSVSLVYCLVAIAIWAIRDLVFTRHALTHFTLTFFACSLTQVILRGHFVMTAGPSHAGMIAPSLMTGVYTAAWAVLIHHILLRCSAALGLATQEPVIRRTANAL